MTCKWEKMVKFEGKNPKIVVCFTKNSIAQITNIQTLSLYESIFIILWGLKFSEGG